MSRKILLLTAVLGSLLGQATAARPRRVGAVSLTVSVFNDAEIPISVLRTARVRAEAVFDEAGIALTWLDCGTPGHRVADIDCPAITYPTHLSVRLAKGRGHRSEDIFGVSFLDHRGQGNYASVYMTPLASSKALGVLSEGELLGYVIVHELGHLLLGKNSHSPEGVMRPVWQFEDLKKAARGTLLFTSSQVERMQARYLSASLQRSTAVSRANNGYLSPSGSPSMVGLIPPSE